MNILSAAEILSGESGLQIETINERFQWAISAMQLYAEQYIDLASERAEVKVEGGNGYASINKSSILQIKNELK